MADLLNPTSSVSLAPSASTTQTVLPDWYTNYAQQVLANQTAQSATPYAPYTGPRVADFTPDQQAGFTATEAAAPSYQPGLAAATQTVNNTAGVSPSTLAQPYLTAAGAPTSSLINNEMSPYIGNVLDQIATYGNRNLTQKILPAIGDEFVGAGGYGGSRQAEAIGRAVQGTQDDITQQQAAALNTGYTAAQQAAETDLSRQGALATTAGNLGVADVNSGLATGSAQAGLAAQQQQLGLQGAGALQTIGGQQQQLNQTNLTNAYQDYLTQQGYNQTQINAMMAAISGTAPAVPKSTLQTGYGAADTSSQTSTPSTLQTVAGILAALNT